MLLNTVQDFPEADRPRLVEWALKFQQMTGPIMAKSVEDTVFYTYNRLASLNEVGGAPDRFGMSVTAKTPSPWIGKRRSVMRFGMSRGIVTFEPAMIPRRAARLCTRRAWR